MMHVSSLNSETSEPQGEQGLPWGSETRGLGELSARLCLQEGLFWGGYLSRGPLHLGLQQKGLPAAKQRAWGAALQQTPMTHVSYYMQHSLWESL